MKFGRNPIQWKPQNKFWTKGFCDTININFHESYASYVQIYKKI